MKLLQSSLSWIFSFLLVLTPSFAYADPVTPVPLTHQGQAGVWFKKDDAAKVLGEVRKVPEYKEAIKTQERLIELKDLQIRNATTALALTETLYENSEETSELWRKAYLDEVDRRDSIFNQPVFWVIVGVAAGGAVAAAVAATQ